MTRPAAPCAALAGGVAALGRAAAAVYGTGKTVQYRNADGGYVTTASFGELLREAVFSDEDMAALKEQAQVVYDMVRENLGDEKVDGLLEAIAAA